MLLNQILIEPYHDPHGTILRAIYAANQVLKS